LDGTGMHNEPDAGLPPAALSGVRRSAGWLGKARCRWPRAPAPHRKPAQNPIASRPNHTILRQPGWLKPDFSRRILSSPAAMLHWTPRPRSIAGPCTAPAAATPPEPAKIDPFGHHRGRVGDAAGRRGGARRLERRRSATSNGARAGDRITRRSTMFPRGAAACPTSRAQPCGDILVLARPWLNSDVASASDHYCGTMPGRCGRSIPVMGRAQTAARPGLQPIRPCGLPELLPQLVVSGRSGRRSSEYAPD